MARDVEGDVAESRIVNDGSAAKDSISFGEAVAPDAAAGTTSERAVVHALASPALPCDNRSHHENPCEADWTRCQSAVFWFCLGDVATILTQGTGTLHFGACSLITWEQ
jgi:hypothetical protein